MHSFFFAVIGITMAVAAALQFYIAQQIEDKCALQLRPAPLLAGATILGSFLFNGVWVYAKRHNKTTLARMSILLWTTCVVVGTAGAGAAAGQAELYHELECDIDMTSAVHYVSIVLLALSISLPHALQKRQEHAGTAASTGQPETSPLVQTPPLRFL